MVGGTPSPRKESAASDRITLATLKEAMTMSGATMFGRMVWKMMVEGAGAERARRIDIFLLALRSDCFWPRAMRA